MLVTTLNPILSCLNHRGGGGGGGAGVGGGGVGGGGGTPVFRMPQKTWHSVEN